MPKKILLADDSITIQKVIGITFANEDYELTVVDNGADAIIKAREVVPDLVLADVVMPQKDGYEVCREIKSDPSLAAIPVILLKGTFEAFDEAKSKEVGADDDITKPFESQTLISKVKEHLAKSPAAAPAPTTEPTPVPIPEPVVATPVVPEPAPATPEPAFDDVVDLGEDEVMQVPEEESSDDDMWGDTDFGDVEEVSTEPQVEPVMEEEIVPEEDMWGDMDLGETEEVTSVESAVEEVALEEPMSSSEDDFADFGVDEDLSAGIEGVETEAFMDVPVSEDAFGLEEEIVETPVVEEPPVVEETVPPVAPPVTEPTVETPTPPVAAAAPASVPASGGMTEGQLSAAVSEVSREIIEKIAWEVVPELAETLIKEEIKRLKGA